MENAFKICCSFCEWEPDGNIHWSCSCGHGWNTFDTKGKCPNCNIQWEMTKCPGCGNRSPHEAWYKSKVEIEAMGAIGDPMLKSRKRKLEKRLIEYGIKHYRVSDLNYLDDRHEAFKPAYEAGCRMIILYVVAQAAQNLKDRIKAKKWLKSESLWERVSPMEKEMFGLIIVPKKQRMDYSWHIEGAITLGWCLNIIPELPKLDNKSNEEAIEKLLHNMPNIGEPTSGFLNNLKYRDFAEIYEETLLNELITTYFRDLLFNGQKDETEINRFISFERHTALNWLRSHMGMEEWDETDTST